MSRGRHARPGLLARLWPRRRRLSLRVDRLRALEQEMAGLRVLGIAHAVAAARADTRARRAEQAVVRVDEELARLRSELDITRTEVEATRTELATTRTELAVVREDQLWAFAAARPATRPPVLDLRDGAARTA